jgi:hypothetical protein
MLFLTQSLDFNSMNGSFDEMDMNEMFEKQLDELDTDDDKLDEVGGINGEWDEEEELTGPSDEDNLFESFEDPQDQSILNHRIHNQNQRQFHGPSAAQHANNTHAYHQGNHLSRFQQSQTTPDGTSSLLFIFCCWTELILDHSCRVFLIQYQHYTLSHLTKHLL